MARAEDDRDPGAAEDDGRIGWRDLTVWRTPVGRALASAARRVERWIGPHGVLAVTLLVGGVLVVGLTAASAEVYEAVVEADGVAGLDQPVLDAAVAGRTPALDAVVTAYTDLGGPVGMPILASIAAIAMAWIWRRWTPIVLMAAAAAGSLLMTVAGKALVDRARPPLAAAVPPYESSPSFPSGHSLNAVVLAGVVAYLLVSHQRTARARVLTAGAAGLFAVTMGLTRVFLGHHWLTDVLVAWTLGLAWLTLVITAHRLYLTVSRR